MKRQYLFLVGLLVFSAALAYWSWPRTEVFVIIGESNADGKALLRDLAEDDVRVDLSAVNIATSIGSVIAPPSGFTPLVLGSTQQSNDPSIMFGPEVGIARDCGSHCYIVKVGRGGSRLAPSSAGIHPNETWNAAEEVGRGLIHAALDQIAFSLDEVGRLEGRAVRRVTVAFLIGLNDSTDLKYAPSARDYLSYLDGVRGALTKRWPDINIRLVVVGPHSDAAGVNDRALRNIRHAMAVFGDREGVDVILPDGFGLERDGVHYNAAGNLRIGASIAE